MNIMRIYRNRKGQAIVETALVLFILLVLLLAITEFARAWFTKNSLKNAVRHGARVAVVTAAATTTSCPINSGQILCPESRTFTPCLGSGLVNAVCTSPGVSSNAQVSVCYKDETGGATGTLDQGDTINVCAKTTFNFVVGGYHFTFLGLPIWPWAKTIQMTTDASMRYE